MRVPSLMPVTLDDIVSIKFITCSIVQLTSVTFSEINSLKTVDIYNVKKCLAFN